MKWPPGFEPDRSPVFAHNEITIAAPPERVWRRLIRAAGWPGWYTNSSTSPSSPQVLRTLRRDSVSMEDVRRDDHQPRACVRATARTRLGRARAAHRVSRMAYRAGGRWMPRDHRRNPEWNRPHTRVVVPQLDAETWPSELDRRPEEQSRSGRTLGVALDRDEFGIPTGTSHDCARPSRQNEAGSRAFSLRDLRSSYYSLTVSMTRPLAASTRSTRTLSVTR